MTNIDTLTFSVRADPFNLGTSPLLNSTDDTDHIRTTVNLGIPQLRHFLYKSKDLLQLVEPKRLPPYTSSNDWKRLVRLYHKTRSRLHSLSTVSKILAGKMVKTKSRSIGSSMDGISSSKWKVVFERGSHESILVHVSHFP